MTTDKESGRRTARRWRDLLPPLVAFFIFIGAWYLAIPVLRIQPYLLPEPQTIIRAGIDKWQYLLHGLALTFGSALIAFALAIGIGFLFATIMSQSRIIERMLYPYAIVLQTIPIVAIAPMVVVWFGAGRTSIAVIAFIIAVFPIISNTTLGLTSTDHNLINLLELYNASRLQMLRKLRIPHALPYIFGALRISAGLSIVGAIVGEFVAGLGGNGGGLGYQIAEAASYVNTPYLFAVAIAACILGLVVFLTVNAASAALLRKWHESQATREN